MSAVYDVPPRRSSRSHASSPSTSPTAASTMARRSAAGGDLAGARLLPRVVGHDQQHHVEVEGVADVHGRDQVTHVGRVEGAPEDPDPCAPRLVKPSSTVVDRRKSAGTACHRGTGSHGKRRRCTHRQPPGPDPGGRTIIERNVGPQPEVGIATMSDSVGLYLNEIGQVPLLNAEEERELSQIIESRPRGPGAHRRRRAIRGPAPRRARRRRRQGPVHPGQPAPRRERRPPLPPAPDHGAARPRAGGQPRPRARRRQVRLAQGLQVLHLRHLLDPPGHRPGPRPEGAASSGCRATARPASGPPSGPPAPRASSSTPRTPSSTGSPARPRSTAPSATTTAPS